jgi:hypothetical protein
MIQVKNAPSSREYALRQAARILITDQVNQEQLQGARRCGDAEMARNASIGSFRDLLASEEGWLTAVAARSIVPS